MLRKAVDNRFFIFFIVLFYLSIPGCTTDPVETDLLLPVDFSNIPENMVLTGFHTDKIEIKVRAIAKLIEETQTEGTRYPVDLYTDLAFDPAGSSVSIEPGEYLIPVETDRIALRPGVKIIGTKPSYLTVRLEKKIKKSFKIKVPYIGRPPKGYMVLDAVAEPAGVELTGPFPLIHSIKEIKTKPIDLTDARQSFKKKIPLDLKNPSVIPVPGHIVTVTVPVKEILMIKTIRDIPVTVRNASRTVTIEPPRITIKVKGPFETLESRGILNHIQSFIDLKELDTGVYARHATIDIPVGLVMTDAVPRVFTVKIE